MIRQTRNLPGFALMTFAALFFVETAIGQFTTGNILGKVVDPSGAAMPGAKISASNTLTGETRTTTANEIGEFFFPTSPVGRYRIQVEAAGFKRSIRDNVELTVNQNARVDVTLEVGALEQQVEITADATPVNTYDAQVGHLVETQRVTELPLNGRNVYDLFNTLPGVARLTSRTVQARDNNTVSVNGGRPGTNNFMLDGGYNNDIWRNSGNTSPNPDAIQEFRVLTSNMNAEFGRMPGATINIITKSGTNQLHGSLFEFLRNDKLNARNFFQSTVSPLKQNQFGGSLGGPVIRNKTFLFGSYEQLVQRTTAFVNSPRTPTAQERIGDFSFLPPNQWPRDPTTNQPFPNGRIPADRIDPVSKAILDKWVPAPNTAEGRFQALQSRPADQWQFLGKGDHQFNESHKLGISYFHLYTEDKQPFPFNNEIPGYGARVDIVRQKNLVVNHNWIINPRAFNEARFALMRRETPWNMVNNETLSDLGVKMNVAATPPVASRIGITGRWNMGTWQAEGLDQTLTWSNTTTLVRGRHNLKFGAFYLWGFYFENGVSAGVGSVSANGNFTGNALADFLTGRVAFSQDNGHYPDLRSKALHTFFQDDWKIHPRLTLNLGLRYELTAPLVWTVDWMQNFRFGARSTVFPTAPEGMLFVGDDGATRGGRKFDRNNIAPRIGLAYDLFGNGKTAVRAAYGSFYLAQYGDGIRASQPYGIALTNNDARLSDPWTNFAGGNPFPIDLSNPRFVTPIRVIYFDANAATPYAQHVNLSIDQEVMRDFSVQVSYIGSFTRKLQLNRDANAARYIPGQSTTANTNARRPYMPGTYERIAEYQTAATANYNGLQMTAKRRFRGGLSLMAHYTFAKTIDLISGDQYNEGVSLYDSNNARLNRGRADGQPHHIGGFSFLWQLPDVNAMGAFGKYALSGWQLNGIMLAQSGSPFTVTAGFDTNYDGNANDRADLAGDPSMPSGRSRQEKIASWFNTKAFTRPVDGSPGNSGRNILTGPGGSNWDLSVLKNFTIREGHKLQFRAEGFNAFNQVWFGNPVSAINNANFGRILSARTPRVVQFGLRYAF